MARRPDPLSLVPSIGLLLALSFGLSSAAAASSCASLDAGPADPISRRHHCFAAAANQRRSVVVVTDNGTCLLCGPPSANAGSGCRHRDSACAAYSAVAAPPDNRLLLFRTHAASRAKPYALFVNGTANDTLMEAQQVAKTQAWYKSPLFDVAHRMGMTEVQLELLSGDGGVAVRLGFSWSGGRLQDEGSWMSKERLVSAYPWRVGRMRNETFSTFSINGVLTTPYTRRFFISLVGNDCQRGTGYLLICEKCGCTWECNSAYSPAYLWTPNGGLWSAERREAVVFQVFGVFRKGSSAGVYASTSVE